MTIDLTSYDARLREYYPAPSPGFRAAIWWDAFCSIWLFISYQARDDQRDGVERPRWVIERPW